MKNGIEISATATVVGENEINEIEYLGVKPGTGRITLKFERTNPRKNEYGDEEYDIGTIVVYASGEMYLSWEDNKNLEGLYQIFKAIHGPNAPELPKNNNLKMPLISSGLDKERFQRVKAFLKDNNIELKYSENIAQKAR